MVSTLIHQVNTQLSAAFAKRPLALYNERRGSDTYDSIVATTTGIYDYVQVLIENERINAQRTAEFAKRSAAAKKGYHTRQRRLAAAKSSGIPTERVVSVTTQGLAQVVELKD